MQSTCRTPVSSKKNQKEINHNFEVFFGEIEREILSEIWRRSGHEKTGLRTLQRLPSMGGRKASDALEAEAEAETEAEAEFVWPVKRVLLIH